LCREEAEIEAAAQAIPILQEIPLNALVGSKSCLLGGALQLHSETKFSKGG